MPLKCVRVLRPHITSTVAPLTSYEDALFQGHHALLLPAKTSLTYLPLSSCSQCQAEEDLRPSSVPSDPASNRDDDTAMAQRVVHAMLSPNSGTRATRLHRIFFELLIIYYHFCISLPLSFLSSLTTKATSSLFSATATARDRVVSTFSTAFAWIAMRFYATWLVRTYIPKHDIGLDFTPSVSFGGGGMLWCYYLGVGHFIYKNFDVSRIKFLASSGGCFAAVPLAMGFDPYDWCRRDWPYCLTHYRTRPMGCFLDTTTFYRTLWDNYLPEDAHLRANDKLFISMTLFPSFKNKVVSRFATRDDLINCIIASTCLPVIFLRDIPRTPYGLALDSGLTNDQPCIDRYTVTVSVLNDEADIKPLQSLSCLDMLRIPSLNEAFRTARAAEKTATRTDCWKRREWQDIRRPLPAATPHLSPNTAFIARQRCDDLAASAALRQAKVCILTS